MRSKSSSRGPPAKRRILIVDDHAILRRGLTALIDNEPDLIVCAQAATQRDGLDAIASSRPDLVIADLSRTDGDGLKLVRKIRSGHKHLPVLVLSLHDAEIYAERAFQAGASGYLNKQEMAETLLSAIRCLLNGGKYERPKTRKRLADQ